MISAELKQLLEGGLSLLVGTRDARLVPDYVRAVGARVERGGRELTVFVPAATAAVTMANVAENGRIAVCVSRPADHRTIQLKGRVVASRAADGAERELVDRYRAGFAAALAFLGVPPRLILRMNHWPAHALTVRVETVFDQTPGPGAGAEIGRAAAPRKAAP